MKHFYNGIFLLLILASPILFASQAKFSIVPANGSVTTLLIPNNFTETVRYIVTNQTAITRTLTMKPMTGVTQTTGVGVCSNPFTLAQNQSCILSLVIDASLIPASGISGGPVICKTNSPSDTSPDPFLCSQPTPSNTLAVSITTTGQHAYIANQFGNSISICQVNSTTGLLTNCSIAASSPFGFPEGVGFNPSGTFFYAANPDVGNSSITVCQVDIYTGTLNACVDAGGSGFNLPDAVAFSSDGTIFYTSNFGTNTVTACLVNAANGVLSSCVNTASPSFSQPGNMAVNADGTLAYVVNRTANTVSVCRVMDQTLELPCDDSSGSLINAPEGVTLSPSGLRAYIANAGNGTVVACDIRQDGTGLLSNCSVVNSNFTGTGNVGLNNFGSFAYVPDQAGNSVYVCTVDLATGAFTSCTRQLGLGLSGPAGIVLK